MSKRFDTHATPIVGLHVLQRKLIGDDRGYLERLFCAEELQDSVSGNGIAQINHSFTAARGTVRGLHFQYPPHAEIKFVSCLRGEVFDVAVDLRSDSPTFLCWHGEVLSAENHITMVIPEGFAHGFQTLSDNCEMLYLHTAPYRSDAEDGLNIRDPRLAIQWPLPVAALSERDAAFPLLDDTFTGVQL
jgi:dTDP-4-dehydrorhamnose 3,5-epimerase